MIAERAGQRGVMLCVVARRWMDQVHTAGHDTLDDQRHTQQGASIIGGFRWSRHTLSKQCSRHWRPTLTEVLNENRTAPAHCLVEDIRQFQRYAMTHHPY